MAPKRNQMKIKIFITLKKISFYHAINLDILEQSKKMEGKNVEFEIKIMTECITAWIENWGEIKYYLLLISQIIQAYIGWGCKEHWIKMDWWFWIDTEKKSRKEIDGKAWNEVCH